MGKGNISKILDEGDFKEYIQTIIDRYVPLLGLTNYIIEVKPGCKNKYSYFECQFNYPYLNNYISFSKLALKEWMGGKDFEAHILHELCHIITDPFYSKANARHVTHEEILDERERLTDQIAHIVYKLCKINK